MSDGEDIITAWIPEQNPHRLATFAKAIEECNELSIALSRCIMQGIDKLDPATGRSNRIELEREMSDVRATLALLGEQLSTFPDHARAERKLRGYRQWMKLLAEHFQ